LKSGLAKKESNPKKPSPKKPDTKKPDPKKLEAARQEHIGRYLHRAARAFNDRALEKLRARGHEKLGLVHMNLLPHLDLDGTRLTTLAERAGSTKQAVGQLVDELVARGYIERNPDPNDGRGTLVCFTKTGWQFLTDAQAIKLEIESEYQAALGATTWKNLNKSLQALLQFEAGK
jgi:DNA-binding MarR family transcriptional regulator